jgi:hypothetical protein
MMGGTGRNAVPAEKAAYGGRRNAVRAAIVLLAVVIMLPSMQYLSGLMGSVSGLEGGRAKNGSGSTDGRAAGRGQFNFPADGVMSLRFYNSTAPANGKLAGLQKGAVLVVEGNETVGEGAGFGAPVLEFGGRTYFSRTARTEPVEGGLSKVFRMDAVEVGPAYHTSFVPVEPAGEVEVSYRVNGSVLSVDVNLKNIPHNATLMVLNEQAGSVYYLYTDLESRDAVVDFSWRPVTGRYNCLLDSHERGFRVDYPPEIRNGTVLYLGRETQPAGFDWAGLDFSIDAAAFGDREFSYTVHLLEG